MQTPRQRLLITASVIAVALCVATCNGLKKSEDGAGVKNLKDEEFAGSISCRQCHKDISEAHKLTAHFRSSQVVNVTTSLGNFSPGNNTFVLNDRLKVMMEKKSDTLFQTGFVDGWKAIRKPMELIIGAGRKAQTYLYWQDNKLFQLPVSYYSPLNAWCNSPGYPTDRILFDRPITARCIECHGTYAKTVSEDNTDLFDRDQMILGVDCERCHGPAKAHVDFQLQNPGKKDASLIVNPSKLSRQLQLDNCALCHSGVRKLKQPAFSFAVGDKLEEFSIPDYSNDSVAALDVHGNQYGLLTSSKCFISSEMDCSSCHNVHVKEAEQLNTFSQRCSKCHEKVNHTFDQQLSTQSGMLTGNCIDCHMPALPSRQVFLRVENKTQSAPEFVRTHRIAVYKEETEKFLERLKTP
ncbi:MAG: multiheme c-type cytochrome [Chryseolinea sp.]